MRSCSGVVRHPVRYARAFEVLSYIVTRAMQQSLREALFKTCICRKKPRHNVKTKSRSYWQKGAKEVGRHISRGAQHLLLLTYLLGLAIWGKQGALLILIFRRLSYAGRRYVWCPFNLSVHDCCMS